MYKRVIYILSSLFIITSVILTGIRTEARRTGHSKKVFVVDTVATSGDSITVSLITCYPGPEVYELCGHEAIRIRTASTDSVWNFGMFNFNEPNFIYRFVTGETDYRLMGYPFAWFLPEYASRGSRVVEQELNLTQGEAAKLRSILQHEGIPENSYYRYNYLKDNCATRIVDKLDSVAESEIRFPSEQAFRTWRDEMRHYHRDYPWYQFGIDLALGSGLDKEMRGRDDMFVPMEMMKKTAKATLPDGRPLLREERVLCDGSPDATLPPTPWWLTPLFWSLVVLAASVIVTIVEIRSARIYRVIYFLWFGLLGLTGCLSAFLVFVSQHEATSPNLLLFWLNPLQLVFPLFIWSRRTIFLPTAMSYVNSLVLTLLLIVWPFQSQSANPAFFPLILTTLLLSIAFAITSRNPRYISRFTERPRTVRATVRKPSVRKTTGKPATRRKKK